MATERYLEMEKNLHVHLRLARDPICQQKEAHSSKIIGNWCWGHWKVKLFDE